MKTNTGARTLDSSSRSPRAHVAAVLLSVAAIAACPATVDPAGHGGGGTGDPCQLESWHITKDTTLTSACGDYTAAGDVDVDNGATLTIEAGVELSFAAGAALRVGHDGPGRLIADGTAEDPVMLSASSSSWGGVTFGPLTLRGSVIEDAVISDGGAEVDDNSGATRGCLTVLAGVGAVSVKRTTLSACGQAGLSLPMATSILAELSEITFAQSDIGVEVHALIAATIGADHTFDGTASNRLLGGFIDTTAVVPALDVPWLVDGSLTVAGADAPMLIIDAGAELQFEGGAALEVGTAGAGGLIARGSSMAPISLNSPDGDWAGVVFGPLTSMGSTLEYVTISGAGQAVAPAVEGCVSVDSYTPGAVSITNSTFDACTGAGVAATGDGFVFGEFADNTFSGMGASAGVRVAASAVGSIGDNDYADAVDHNEIVGGTVTWPATWRQQGVHWLVESTVHVQGEAAMLTLDAGVELRFDPDAWLEVGAGQAGSLFAIGATGREVVLDSAAETPASGDWVGVVFGPMVGAGSRLEHVAVRNAGRAWSAATRGCVTVQSATPWAVSIIDSTFSACAQSGVAATPPGAAFGQLEGNTFADSDAGVWVHATAAGSVGLDNVYTNTPHNRMVGGVIDQSAVWVAQTAPWDVSGRLDVGGAASPVLNIWAGTKLRFDEGGWLRVGALAPGGLIVDGLASDAVTFEATTGTAAGSWVGILLMAATTAGTSIDEAVVRHAGEAVAAATQGAISLSRTGSNVSITDVVFQNNTQADIFVDCDSTPALADNTFSAAGQQDEAGCPVIP